MRIDYFFFFFGFHSSYCVNCFHRHTLQFDSIPSNNEDKQRFRTAKNPAESKHIHGTAWEPMGQKHLEKSSPVPRQKQLEEGTIHALQVTNTERRRVDV